MWCYRIRYHGEDDSYHNAEGIVAGSDIMYAIERLKEHYGENAIEDIHMTAMTNSNGILSFLDWPNVNYATFFPEENN